MFRQLHAYSHQIKQYSNPTKHQNVIRYFSKNISLLYRYFHSRMCLHSMCRWYEKLRIPAIFLPFSWSSTKSSPCLLYGWRCRRAAGSGRLDAAYSITSDFTQSTDIHFISAESAITCETNDICYILWANIAYYSRARAQRIKCAIQGALPRGAEGRRISSH